MPITEYEKGQLRQQQALHILKKHLEGGRFNGAKIFCCEPEGWIAAVGRPTMSIRPNGTYVLQVNNKNGGIRQWDDPNHLARWDGDFHRVRQLVLSAATFEEVDPNWLYSAYSPEQTDMEAGAFLNEIRQGNNLIRYDGTDVKQPIGVIIWYSRARLSTKLNIDPIETNVQSLSITVRHEEHKNLTSIDPDNPVPLQYVLAGDGLKIITCYCEQDTQMGSEDPTNEAEETQQDESPEYAEEGNMEAGGSLMGDNPEVYTNVIEEVDTLMDQVETVARGLDVVRHDLGEIQFRIQQNQQNPAPCTCGR